MPTTVSAPTPKPDIKVRTRRFAGDIVRAFRTLPLRREEVRVLGRQMFRSGTSVGANYSEASHARSPEEFIAKVELCSQEAQETRYWLDLLQVDCGLDAEPLRSLWFEANELVAIFITMAKNAKARQSR